ncbi:MAG: DUF3604 domain-containing protein, partial [Nitrospinae bacterium]|nr:DUF3604 domain-containing protein [Nitrospinota bacterium]
GGSDDHTGRQGLVYPNRRSNNVVTFDVKGGLMGLYARELTREAVWEAMRARRTYATNGERIYLKTACGEALMGEEVGVEGPPSIQVEVHGTAPLLDVELKRGAKTIHRHPVNAPEAVGRARRIRVQWSGVTQKSGRDKKVEWRGGIALDRGAMLSHTPYALDQYDDAVTRVSNKVLRFETATSGDPDGVLIDLDASADASLSFFSNVKSFILPISEISTEPTIIPAGGVNIRILVCEVAPTLKDWSARFQFTDEDASTGAVNPYWVRVLQVDGGQAWSSPVYVRCNE